MPLALHDNGSRTSLAPSRLLLDLADSLPADAERERGLSLLEASFPQQIHPGETLSLQIRLQNTGFASPMLPRPVYLVLVGQDNILSLSYPLSADPRRWQPGEHDLTASIPLPSDTPSGDYILALWLPDPADSLRDDPRYAIRFANENVWDAQRGWNVLGTIILK